MTTIPTRFSTIRYTLLSWFSQSLLPKRVIIMVPRRYKRFRRKQVAHSPTTTTAVDELKTILSKDSELHSLESNVTIQVVEIEKDYGPATKFMGVLYLQDHIFSDDIDYWVVGDDDVQYSPITLSKYAFVLHTEHARCAQRCGLTHFSEDYRIHYHLHGDLYSRPVLHVQGVDTYLLPRSAIQDEKRMQYNVVALVVDRIHALCPESLYQDDYVVSLLLSLADIRMHSIWNNDNMASHLEGVSKSNNQMHMSDKVFVREELTQKCIIKYVDEVFSLLNSNHELEVKIISRF